MEPSPCLSPSLPSNMSGGEKEQECYVGTTRPRAGTPIAVEVKQRLREVALWARLRLALIQ